MDIRLAVAAGIEKLNAAKPSWFRTIDTDELNLEDCAVCIIGQVYNLPDRPVGCTAYREALDALGIAPHEAYEYGFDAEDSEIDEYDALRDEWSARIEELVAAVEPYNFLHV